MLLSLLGSRNFRQGDEVLKTFLINNVFHSGLYGTASAGKSFLVIKVFHRGL